jgi:hypothetical protein
MAAARQLTSQRRQSGVEREVLAVELQGLERHQARFLVIAGELQTAAAATHYQASAEQKRLARALDTAPLALPAQLLLKLCAPLALPHASASLVLAVLYALADQRPAAATPLIHRLIHTRGPSGDLWAELLNLGPDTARDGPNTARDGPNTARSVPNTARGGPGAHNSPASLSSSAGSLPPVPPPMPCGSCLCRIPRRGL